MKPSQWELKELGTVATFLSGGTPSKSNPSYWGGTIPWITAKDLKTFYLETSGLKVTEAGAKNGARRVPKGTVLILVRGMALKKDIPLGVTTEEVTFNQDVKALVPKDINPVYLGYYLFYQKPRLMSMVSETGHGAGRLQTDQLSALPISIPSMQEQQKLSDIFALWDKAISLCEKLLNEKKRFGKGLTEQLLSGRKRFPAFSAPWKEVRFSDITRECRQRNNGTLGVEAVRAVNKTLGMIPMRERSIGANLDRYKVVNKNWFAYNPMRINVGSICLWHGDEQALVSPDYVVFECDETRVSPLYVEYLRRIRRWQHYVQAAGNGSVRVRLFYKDLGNIKFQIPSLEEQRKITSLLTQSDREIACYTRYIGLLQQEKKGLMQRLLSEKKRIKSDCTS